MVPITGYLEGGKPRLNRPCDTVINLEPQDLERIQREDLDLMDHLPLPWPAHELTLVGAAGAFRDRKLSVELAKALLARIEAEEPHS